VSGCHAGAAFLQTGAAFKGSSSKARIENDSMPKRSGPNYDRYNSAKKQAMLDYLN
jgi:hypothetical protein